MRLLPHERFAIEADDAPEIVRERLVAGTVPPQRSFRRKRDKPFSGTVLDGSFELRPVLSQGYLNSFAPVAEGSFGSGVGGTHVEVRLRLSRRVAAFMSVWLFGALAFVAAGIALSFVHPSSFWFALAALALFAWGYALMTVGFSVEARRMRRNLESVLVERVPATDLRPKDISWLFDFRLLAAEPLERVFNRIFLAAYAVAGALAVFTWERTASACSSMERRNGFSCPSGGRIVLSWGLLGLLIGTGIASRLAIHRRVRRAYGPLLLVVAVVAVAALWLLVHRDHWGMPK
jgi:hypothetical protein